MAAPRPLGDGRVVAFTPRLPGPLATLMLAEAGAEVIKIERPGSGDEARRGRPRFGADGVDFALLNRCKRSIEVDLKDAGARDALGPVLADADVVVHLGGENIAGRRSRGMLTCFTKMKLAVRPNMLDRSILIVGETGTGKELVSRAIHFNRQNIPWNQGTFTAINCAQYPPGSELLRSELFGHEKGAFTGADSRRIGRFESAEGGTIFLDEIGDMAPETQDKGLRVLEQREVDSVCSTRGLPNDVRVESATHRDLQNEVAAGGFRGALIYRVK